MEKEIHCPSDIMRTQEEISDLTYQINQKREKLIKLLSKAKTKCDVSGHVFVLQEDKTYTCKYCKDKAYSSPFGLCARPWNGN